jgi:hypothetical protein
MIAAINAAATNSAIATLVLSLVGLWVITQLRIWRHVPRAPSRTKVACVVLRGAKLVTSGNDFSDTASTRPIGAGALRAS